MVAVHSKTPTPGSSSAGVQKTSAGVELGICRVYPICTPDQLSAYAECIRCTPDELFFFGGFSRVPSRVDPESYLIPYRHMLSICK